MATDSWINETLYPDWGQRFFVKRELARVRGRLVEFTGEIFESMRRKDQRRWGEVYVRGLMLDGKRKSIEPMAARLADGDEQCLQQFVNQSPWDPVAVRRALARRC